MFIRIFGFSFVFCCYCLKEKNTAPTSDQSFWLDKRGSIPADIKCISTGTSNLTYHSTSYFLIIHWHHIPALLSHNPTDLNSIGVSRNQYPRTNHVTELCRRSLFTLVSVYMQSHTPTWTVAKLISFHLWAKVSDFNKKNKTNQTKGEAAAPLVSIEQTKKCHFCSHVLFCQGFSSHSCHLAELLLQSSCLQARRGRTLEKLPVKWFKMFFLKKLLLSAIVVELPYKSNITVEALPLLFCPVLQLLLEPK